MKIVSDFVTNPSEADYYDIVSDFTTNTYETDCNDSSHNNWHDLRDSNDCNYDSSCSDSIDWDIVNDFYDGDLRDYYNVD